MKSFDKISSGWKRLAGIIAAITTLTTVTVKLSDWDPVKVTACYVLAGMVTLFSGWMLDEHIREFKKTNEENKKRFNHIDNVLHEIREHILETHKDTMRIQLQQQMQHKPDNIDTIIKLAEEYFCKMKGDWYMTNVFMEWCKKHDIDSSIALSCKVERHE